MRRRVFALFIFLLCPLQLVFSQLPPDQVSAITGVYDVLYNRTPGSSFVWYQVDRTSNPCSWRGVLCNPDNSTITQLSLQSSSISTSEFLPILCNIQTLESLDVSNNRLSLIPDRFFTGCGEITGLKLLNFSRNKLNGPLPSFNGFRMLEYLDISHNSISGEINLQLDGLDSLKSLNLSHNLFTGAVPTYLGKMDLLEELQLSFNFFTGEIPVNITKYRNLTLIDLSLNNLTGSAPEEVGELAKLEVLVLSLNNLSGEIPKSLSNITTLSRFAANQNKFVGTVPSGITSYLRSLDLSYNKLTGFIPSDLLAGPNLQSLDLSYNELEGPIPENISKSFFRLRLGSNTLNGSLPAGSLGSLVELIYLELDNNSFIGPIPSELSMCKKLALLNLGQNRLTGQLPPALGSLTGLQVLSLQFNDLVGEIPAEITMLNTLEKLNMSRNSLNGTIPYTISSMRGLKNLDLQGNNLNGPIPDSIGNLSSLIELQLGGNQLSGQIPAMPLSLQIALNLSYNLFSGPIPDTLSRLTQLEVLDLSNNRFSGDIPNSLTRMSSLSQLILTNNQLSGRLPQFPSFVLVEYDKDRIRPTQSTPPPPPAQKQRRASVDISHIIIPVVAAAMAVFLVVLALFISRRYYRINDEHFHPHDEISPPQVIHGNFLTPDTTHRSNIAFSKAMEAVSVPSNVKLKTRFSTYYKVVMPSGTNYFVKKINWSDKIFQLGSHEKFEKELEVLGKLCNSNVMIPLAYVLTEETAYLFYDFAAKGTLSDVLHGCVGNILDWADRYSIAIGVAQGLAFLHGCNCGPILLLDLSSRSIFLKSMNEPQVGDIELCKVIDPSKSTGSLSTVAGSVGYIPPEYAYTMRVTAAGNVYSFGVFLLELLTGKPAVSGGTELAKWVLSYSNNGHQILDSSISKRSPAVRSQMLTVLKVALACVSISPEARPKMKSVLRMLLNAR